jgi:hypothetical protein
MFIHLLIWQMCLCLQIEPRENDIKCAREQIAQMDSELEKYHRINTTLNLQVGDTEGKKKKRKSHIFFYLT